MTWIAYKRGGEFYAKERGNPLTEVRLDYKAWREVQRTGELEGKTAKQLQESQATEIVKEPTSGKKQRKVDTGTKSSGNTESA